jgi:hypothetical protein
MLEWRKVPDMTIPTDSTLPADPDDNDYRPHLPQDELDTNEGARDLITDEAQTDSPIELLQVPPEEFAAELDKQVIEDGASRPKEDYEDVEDYTTMVENSDLNSDDTE